MLWFDQQYSDTSLVNAHPSLFTIACGAEMGGGCWNPTFLRPFNNWEMDDVESLMCWIGGRRVIEGVEDRVQKWFVFY